ncbi:MAG: type II toxin-antitoxin system RelE/ParE family toxin [Nitrospirota bacterium]
MRALFSPRAAEQYAALAEDLKAKFDKQLGFLLMNLRHPSLKAKKYAERAGVWQARVDRNYRFYFEIHGDTYHILAIIPHPK